MKMRMKACIACLLVFIATSGAQERRSAQPSEPDACDQRLTFCWYGEEVEAWGHRWAPQDPSEKPIEMSVDVRCIKSLRICAKARAFSMGGKIEASVEILPVTRWTPDQITADGESAGTDPCERDTYIISRVDRTVLLVATPGPKADTPTCANFMGKPKTVTYKLSQ